VVASEAILLSPDLFLWLPDKLADVVVEFRLPPGYRVSAPLEMLASADPPAIYRAGAHAALGDGGHSVASKPTVSRSVRPCSKSRC
jgi:hypothetical protein